MKKSFFMGIRMIPDGVYIFFVIAFGIVDALAFGYEGIVKNIKLAQVSELYDTLVAFFPNITGNIEKYKYLVLFITLLIVVCYGIKKFYKKKLYLIEHFSLGADRGALSDELKEEYKIKEIIVDQTSQLCNGIPSAEAVRLVDSEAKELVEKSNNEEIGYLGIAHIPLVFRFGYVINDQSEIHSFHRKRGNREKYKELSHNNQANLFFSIKEENKTKRSDELVVAISTSFEITSAEIENNFGKDKHILMLKLNNYGVDLLTDYDVIEHLVFEAWDKIRKYEKDYCIQNLHIVMASSVGFTFFMGKACSPQIDARTIVYHYQNGKYAWGICMNEIPENSIVLME